MSIQEPTIDEMFKATEAFSKKMHEFLDGKNFDEKFAHAMLNATDPDSRFKADIAMKLSSTLNLIDMFLGYINKPIKKEGILQRKLDGTAMLDNVPVPVGGIVEFWKDDKWNLGMLSQNPQTKQLYITDVVSNKTLLEKLDQIKARIR